MRPDMMHTGLETVAYNINRKNADLLLFEFGKTYTSSGKGKYFETECLSLYFTGNKNETSWKSRFEAMDIFFVKGICDAILNMLGMQGYHYSGGNHNSLNSYINISVNDNKIAEAGCVGKSTLEKFSIKQDVFYLNVNWDQLLTSISKATISFKEIPKYPKVQRDLSIILDKKISYQDVEKSVNVLRLKKLTGFKLFDVFESEKLGLDKKSLALTFTFSDVEKTLTDGETDAMMNKIISSLEKDLNAGIRKGN
jgi:phenylalanyl-tRNA synthetase beta chain